MRIFMLLTMTGLLFAPAFAQKPDPKTLPAARPIEAAKNRQEAISAPVQQRAESIFAESISPDSGTRWRVFPASIGDGFLRQHQSLNNEADLIGWTSEFSALSLEIFNPSIRKTASVRVDCGDEQYLYEGDRGILSIEPSVYHSIALIPFMRGGAGGSPNCTVTADTPIIVAAYYKQTVRKLDVEPGYDGPRRAGQPIQKITVPWPTFRLSGPE